MNADLPARGQSTDACRTERVALTNALIQALFQFGRAQDQKQWDEADRALGFITDGTPQLKEACRREAEAVRKGEPGSEAVHGKAPRDAKEVKPQPRRYGDDDDEEA